MHNLLCQNVQIFPNYLLFARKIITPEISGVNVVLAHF